MSKVVNLLPQRRHAMKGVLLLPNSQSKSSHSLGYFSIYRVDKVKLDKTKRMLLIASLAFAITSILKVRRTDSRYNQGTRHTLIDKWMVVT